MYYNSYNKTSWKSYDLQMARQSGEICYRRLATRGLLFIADSLPIQVAHAPRHLLERRERADEGRELEGQRTCRIDMNSTKTRHSTSLKCCSSPFAWEETYESYQRRPSADL